MTTLLIPLPSGDPDVYVVAVTIRAGEREDADRCLAILPPPNDWMTHVPVSCERNAVSMYIQRDLQIDCSVTYPEGASCTAQQGPFVLTVRRAGRVDDFVVQLTHDDLSFAPAHIRPSYESYHPDGPACPGSCDVSTTVVAFESLQMEPP